MDSITAQLRTVLGKKVTTLRKQGLLPAVVYGKNKAAQSIAVPQKEFIKVWKSAGESSLVALNIDNQEQNVLIHEVALDPIKNMPVHADFYLVDLKKEVEVDVSLEFSGVEEAGKASSGILVKVLHELKIKALPQNLPHGILVNVMSLQNPGDVISVSGIVAPAGVTILNAPEDTIAMIEAVKEEVVETVSASAEEAIKNIEVVKEKKETEETEEETKAT